MTGVKSELPAAALRIALVAPPLLPVPPPAYGGTERVVHALAEGLHRLGHDVTLFASGDSEVSCRLVPTVQRACWTGGSSDVEASYASVLDSVWRERRPFDVIHSHLDIAGFELTSGRDTPAVSTMHGRLDEPTTQDALRAHADAALVAISHSQRALAPAARWMGVVPHGLDLHRMPFRSTAGPYLLFVGRVAREKGIVDAIHVADRTGLRLVIAAKVHDATEAVLFETEVRPALKSGCIEFLGELEPAVRDPLFAGARATLMLGDWPEPFGLVGIESLATGTPVIGRRRGAIPEIVEHGVDGFLIDDLDAAVEAVGAVGSLDRRRIRTRAIRRFSTSRMVDDYLVVYRRIVEGAERRPRQVRQQEVTAP